MFKMKTVSFAIRDDDTSFFTSPIDLERAYDFVKNGTISLSVVPFTYNNHLDVFPYGEKEEGYYSITNNKELINFLTNNNKYDILLHGFNHEYRLINNIKTPEMIWKDKERLLNEITEGKKVLESSFNKSIKVFVAPSNRIDLKGISALEMNNLNFSGIISWKKDRKFNIRYLFSYIKRWSFRLFKGFAYPGFLNYGKHKELYAYPVLNVEYLKKVFDYCKKKKHPFVIYTHYWYLNENPSEKQKVIEIYNYAISNGAVLESLNEIFDRSK